MGNTIILPSGEMQINGDAKDVSDTHHTFGELYDHRILLYLSLMCSNPQLSWRASYHHDGTCYDGSFLAGMQLPTGQISYHVPNDFWNLLDEKDIKTYDFAPEWDGHTPEDVLERLEEWLRQ